MDLAYIANGYVYHTNYDTPAAVTPGSIQRAGDNILALVKSIVNSPFLADPGEYRHGSMVFFDFLGIFVIHYPERIGLVINLTLAFVVVLCLMKKFLHFLAKRTIFEEGKVLRLSSGVGDLIISLFILLLSWIVGTSFSVAVGVLLTYSGHSLTWYCQPYLILALYTAPSLLGIGLVHFVIKKSIVAKEKAVSEKKEDNIPLKERISNQLVKKEVETFYAAFLVWTIVMLIVSYYRLASAHLPLLFIIFPPIIRVVIWDNVLTAKTSHENVGAFLFMHLLATLVPVQFCMYLTFAMFDVFMPIIGRAGTQTPPDVFISVLCAFGVVLLTSYMVMDNSSGFIRSWLPAKIAALLCLYFHSK
ncbi:endoplasmic reticulum metallopeptidase 1-like isoform X2 [Pocillopora verrucosa]|uniref:endoplasmic reticulum metallopeptidase 1-like isoform X2 n=1 Tax=Pocillopora verrucosa TaxID=203993 RepID=UPI00333E4D8B